MFAVSAFDAYVHQKLIERLDASFPNPYPEELIEVAKGLFREKPGILFDTALAPDPKRELLASFDAEIHRRTFQHPGAVQDAFRMMGVNDIWTEVAEEIDYKEDRLRKDVAQLIKRRDQIVHEADFDADANRARSIQRWYVEWCLDFFQEIVTAIESVMSRTSGAPTGP